MNNKKGSSSQYHQQLKISNIKTECLTIWILKIEKFIIKPPFHKGKKYLRKFNQNLIYSIIPT